MSSSFHDFPAPANDFGKTDRQPRNSAKGRATDAAKKLELVQLEDRLVPAGQLTGQVFLDFNSNGLLDTTSSYPNDGGGNYTAQADQGVGGVVVTAYDASNTVRGVATTVSDGTYTLSASGTGGYRLEFTNVPNGDYYGPQGTNTSPPPVGSATAVQFVPDGNSGNHNLSLSVPAGYANNPQIVTNEYFIGDQTGTLSRGPKLGTNDYSTSATIISFPYSAGTTDQTSNTAGQAPTTHTLAVQAQYVGATWGLAQNTNTNTILASAFTKKYVGYGPGGPGAIYTMSTTGTTASLWVDLSTLDPGIGGQLATDRAAYTNNDQYFTDDGNVGWDAVGKTSLGGMAISDDNTKVFVMDLNNRELYTIPVNPDGSANVAGITSILIPVPNNATGNTTGTNRGDLRPFAVEYHNGLVYVGMVNSAQSTGNSADLRGYIYTYNPATNQWSSRSVINQSTTVDGFALNYPKATSFGGSDAFNAWTSTFANVNTQFNPNTNNAVKYPQPMLSALAFDANGNLNIAIRDRGGDQLGNQVVSDPSQPNQLDLGISAGDLLKAGSNGNGTWTLENNATVGGTTTGGANDNQGPGGGEYYYQDDYQNGTHTEVQSGAVAEVPGFPDVITTTFDPIRFGVTKTAGIRWYNSTNGTLSKSYQIYDGTTSPGTFGKATGLGDLLVVQPPGGIEIGNRVWNDANGNGRQDPGENGIANVQVILYYNGAAYATATTDANGEYYFSSNAGSSTTNKIFGLNLAQSGTYTIGIPVVQGPLSGLTLTTANISGNTEDQRDSDFTLNANTNRAEFTVPVLARGQSDHSFDAGFRSPNNGLLSGYVYADNNNNGLFETNLGEPPIGAVTLVLTGTDSVGNAIIPLTTTTDGTGFYQFANLLPGTYTVTETQPANYLEGKDTVGSLGGNNSVQDVLSAINLPASGNSVQNNFGELLPAALNGYVYLDINNDGIYETASESPIPGTTVTLTGSNDLGTITPQTLTTDANGFYSFTNLRPGTYTVSETQPPAYANGITTPGSPGGSSTPNNHSDVITTITLTPSLVSNNNDFGELPLASSALSGYVYFDRNNDGNRAGPPNEPGIPNTTLVLTGTTSLGAAVTLTTTTDSTGFYQFTSLQAGTYTVTETQPANYLEGKDTAGSLGGNATVQDVLSGVVIPSNTSSINNNFGELLPLSIGDFVWNDANNDGVLDNGETGLANVTVELVNTGTGAVLTTTTNAQGGYLFTNLLEGTYQVQIRKATLPAGYVSSTGQIGSVTSGPYEPAPASADNKDSGTSFDATFVKGNVVNLRYGTAPTGESPTPGGINDPAANFSDANSDHAEDFGFFKPLSIGNQVYIDTNNDGEYTAGVDTPADGVTVRLVRQATQGNTLQTLTATTAGGGLYLFTNLGQGDYAVELDAPAGYTSATGANGTPVEPATQNNVDGQDKGTNQGGQLIRAGAISLTTTDNLYQDFGLIARASVSGYVYYDLSDDGQRAGPPNEPGIPGTTVVLTGTVMGLPITPLTTTTDADGFYSFNNLDNGVYTVSETQPAGYLQGKDAVGNYGGNAGVQDVLSSVTLAAGNAGTEYDFGEILPAALNGYVYVDPNNNGLFEAGEPPLAGITVTLTGTDDQGNPVTQSQTTNAAGFYSFTNLRPGTYAVAETSPGSPYVDGKDTPGVPGGGIVPSQNNITQIRLTPGLTSPNNNFAELLYGQLSGYVYRDPNVNGQYEPSLGEKGIAGTKVVLYSEGTGGLTAVSTAFTANDGFYQFKNLTPGNYRVVETQPLGFYQGLDTPGTTGGKNSVQDVLSAIPIVGGANSLNNNFGEVQNVNLFGYVWIDSNRNGIFDPGEAGIPNAVVTISGTAFAGTPISTALNSSQSPSGLTVTTDANGFYIFTKLPPGSYNLVQTNTPPGLSDFASQNAAPGLPIQLSTNTTFGGIGLQTPAPGPLNFGKVLTAPTQPANQLPSKDSFLGSSLLGAVAPTGNPLVSAPTTTVSTTPQFSVTNTTSTKPVYLAAGAGAGFAPVVRVFNYQSGAEVFRFTAFDSGFLGGVDVATGDVNGDGIPDIIVGAGAGAGPHVEVFDGSTGALIQSFYAFDPSFRGGVMVASGDVNGDGYADIIVGAMSGTSPHVKVFDGKTGQLLDSFIAFDASVTTGVRVAAGDVNGDGKADIIVSTAEGVPAQFKVFSGADLSVIESVAPFDGFAGGIYVTSGDFDGDGKSDVIVSAGAGAGPRVSVYNGSGTQLASFFAGDPNSTAGVRVAAKDLNGDGKADIITGAGVGTASRITAYSGAGLGIIEDFYLFDSGVRTGIYVG